MTDNDNFRNDGPQLSGQSAEQSSAVGGSNSVPLTTLADSQSTLSAPIFGQQQFVEEIDYNEIETEEVIGTGSFGVVWKGRWRGRYVAVKHIDTEGERRAFAIEVRQLSRVTHPNIVKLYGACTRNPVCLVMEYAEGGSLYNVLHCEPQPRYTAAHAMSWALQCARGVAYLHNMRPKPLIHRDLKPPNLLLVFGGRTLKICDFGTACDLNTYMTNNKGSAAWMAPEVFEGSRYTEKCDVFSWGIILWEVLSRQKPFDDIGGSAYRIMWAVHIGQRPPLMDGCPRPIEQLIVQCWRKIPEERPSMNEVVRIMTHLSEFFLGNAEPLEYSSLSSPTSPSSSSSSSSSSVSNTLNQLEEKEAKKTAALGSNSDSLALPPYEASNRESYNSTSIAVPSLPRGEPSALSSPSPSCHFQPLHVHCEPDAWESSHSSSDSSWEIRNMAGLDKMLPKKNRRKKILSPHSELDNVYRLLDDELRPLTPDLTCQLSQDIFQQHKQLAQEYLKVQTEIALVGQHKTEMLKSLSNDALGQQLELQKLEDEKESLVKLYRNLKRQLEIMKGQQGGSVAAHSAVIRHDESTTTAAEAPLLLPHRANVPAAAGAIPSGDDGWIVVPRQELSRIS